MEDQFVLVKGDKLSIIFDSGDPFAQVILDFSEQVVCSFSLALLYT